MNFSRRVELRYLPAELRKLAAIMVMVPASREVTRLAESISHDFQLKQRQFEASGSRPIHYEDSNLGHLTRLDDGPNDSEVGGLLLGTKRLLGEVIAIFPPRSLDQHKTDDWDGPLGPSKPAFNGRPLRQVADDLNHFASLWECYLGRRDWSDPMDAGEAQDMRNAATRLGNMEQYQWATGRELAKAAEPEVGNVEAMISKAVTGTGRPDKQPEIANTRICRGMKTREINVTSFLNWLVAKYHLDDQARRSVHDAIIRQIMMRS